MKIAILGLASAVLLIEESPRKRTGVLWRWAGRGELSTTGPLMTDFVLGWC